MIITNQTHSTIVTKTLVFKTHEDFLQYQIALDKEDCTGAPIEIHINTDESIKLSFPESIGKERLFTLLLNKKMLSKFIKSKSESTGAYSCYSTFFPNKEHWGIVKKFAFVSIRGGSQEYHDFPDKRSFYIKCAAKTNREPYGFFGNLSNVYTLKGLTKKRNGWKTQYEVSPSSMKELIEFFVGEIFEEQPLSSI